MTEEEARERGIPLEPSSSPSIGDIFLDVESGHINLYLGNHLWFEDPGPGMGVPRMRTTEEILTPPPIDAPANILEELSRILEERDREIIGTALDTLGLDQQEEEMTITPVTKDGVTTRRFEYKSGNSNKFWEIQWFSSDPRGIGPRLQSKTRWGKITSNPLGSQWSATHANDINRKIQNKLRKGYVEVQISSDEKPVENKELTPKQKLAKDLKAKMKHPLYLF